MKKLAAHWRYSQFTRTGRYFHRLRSLNIRALLSVALLASSSSPVHTGTIRLTHGDRITINKNAGAALYPSPVTGFVTDVPGKLNRFSHTCCGFHCRLNLFT